VAAVEGGLVQRWHHHGNVVFRTGGLAYDTVTIYRERKRRIVAHIETASYCWVNIGLKL